jgi:hypothetical protein
VICLFLWGLVLAMHLGRIPSLQCFPGSRLNTDETEVAPYSVTFTRSLKTDGAETKHLVFWSAMLINCQWYRCVDLRSVTVRSYVVCGCGCGCARVYVILGGRETSHRCRCGMSCNLQRPQTRRPGPVPTRRRERGEGKKQGEGWTASELYLTDR